MGAKKKKKSKKKKEKKEPGDEEDKPEENPLFKVELPEYNWIRIELRLCDPPSNFNHFYVVMRSNDRILEVKKRIVEYHGKISDIQIYNRDPIPARNPKNLMKQNKPRVPPFRELETLKQLKVEFEHKTE